MSNSEQHTPDSTTGAVEVVEAYLAATRPDDIRIDRLRKLIADDVVVDDALMSCEGADAYLAAMTQVAGGPGGATSTVQHVVAEADDADDAGLDNTRVVAARVLFEAPGLTVQFSQWFWVADGRIRRIEVIYDPRAFLAMAPAE